MVLWMCGAEKHDGGYLRLQLGGGFTSMRASSGVDSAEISGGGAALGISAGFAIMPNVIIYGAIMDSVASNPTVKINGVASNSNGSAGVVGIGPGAAFYIEPSNMFLSATLLFSQLVIQDSDGNKVGESEWGATFELEAGKEWWVSDNWGLGGSAQLMVGAMKDKDTLNTGNPPTWNLVAFSILFCATYN